MVLVVFAEDLRPSHVVELVEMVSANIQGYVPKLHLFLSVANLKESLLRARASSKPGQVSRNGSIQSSVCV